MSFISVVIPLYNKEGSINDTIYSVLNQTFEDFQLIVINDGSSDNSFEIVKAIKDNRIILINKENEGVSATRNRGIIEANTEYIAFLDGDDIWSPEHLNIVVKAIKENDNNLIGGFGTSFYKSSYKQFNLALIKESNPQIIKDYFEFMSSPKPRFNSSTIVIKKSKVLECGLFDVTLKYGEDVEFWYRLFKHNKLVYI